jgi:hypothetical protein
MVVPQRDVTRHGSGGGEKAGPSDLSQTVRGAFYVAGRAAASRARIRGIEGVFGTEPARLTAIMALFFFFGFFCLGGLACEDGKKGFSLLAFLCPWRQRRRGAAYLRRPAETRLAASPRVAAEENESSGGRAPRCDVTTAWACVPAAQQGGGRAVGDQSRPGPCNMTHQLAFCYPGDERRLCQGRREGCAFCDSFTLNAPGRWL